jgi:hypothetical protein
MAGEYVAARVGRFTFGYERGQLYVNKAILRCGVGFAGGAQATRNAVSTSSVWVTPIVCSADFQFSPRAREGVHSVAPSAPSE